MWTGPWRVKERLLNSYTLESLDGEQLKGEYNARRLREFIPREGTELETEQRIFEMVREELGSRGDIEEEEKAAGDTREIDIEEEAEITGDRDIT